MGNGPDLTMRIRREGHLVIAYIRHPKKGPMNIGTISAVACDRDPEVFEDFQALMVKSLKALLLADGYKIESFHTRPAQR